MLPERCAENSVGRLDRLLLRCHSAEVALVQRCVEASFQRRVDVGQSHQVLGFLKMKVVNKLNFKTDHFILGCCEYFSQQTHLSEIKGFI